MSRFEGKNGHVRYAQQNSLKSISSYFSDLSPNNFEIYGPKSSLNLNLSIVISFL